MIGALEPASAGCAAGTSSSDARGGRKAADTQNRLKDGSARSIQVMGGQEQLVLPGMLWPAGRNRGQSNPVFFEKITKGQANDLITEWGHPLGPYNRPFGYQAWGLAIDGEAVAVAVSGSTVGATSAGFQRRQVVDLARIARNPDHPGILRVMLRLWRDYFGPRWDDWDAPVHAAVSYALPGKEGNLYRFDGWKLYGECKPWAGGATWSNPSKANEMADGKKKLYYYEYPSAARDVHALLGAAGFEPGVKRKKHHPGTSGFIVTGPAPGSVRVRYHSIGKVSAVRGDAILAAYAEAIGLAGYAVMTDCDSHELVVAATTPPGSRQLSTRQIPS